MYSNPVEVPPHRPACVERSFHNAANAGMDENDPVGGLVVVRVAFGSTREL